MLFQEIMIHLIQLKSILLKLKSVKDVIISLIQAYDYKKYWCFVLYFMTLLPAENDINVYVS